MQRSADILSATLKLCTGSIACGIIDRGGMEEHLHYGVIPINGVGPVPTATAANCFAKDITSLLTSTYTVEVMMLRIAS